MNKSTGFVAGVVGAAVMTVLMALGRRMGLPINLEMMMGSLLTGETGETTWLIGLLMHFVAGGIIGTIYAALIHGRTTSANTGAAVGIAAVHTLISGVAMGVVPLMHPLIPETMPAPGMFLVNLGAAAVIAFVLLHLLYGAVVGWLGTELSHRGEPHPAHG